MQLYDNLSYYTYIPTQIPYIPKLKIIFSKIGLCQIILPFQDSFNDISNEHYILNDNSEIGLCVTEQFAAYFNKNLKKFTIPLDIKGTIHQQKIWGLLQNIPYGTTMSYKNISDLADSSPRAVGGANRKNPIPIIIPCHRVINHNGSLGGYFGTTNTQTSEINLKQILLNLEKSAL